MATCPAGDFSEFVIEVPPTHTPVLNAYLQLLTLLIAVAIAGFGAYFLTLRRKARVRTLRAFDCVTALPEFWTFVAEHSGLVGAWRLTGVCTAAREGAKGWLRTLPGLVVCGGVGRGGEFQSAAWRLDLGELRWEHTSTLAIARANHACCVVRGAVVVLGGQDTRYTPGENEVDGCFTASVEILGHDSEAEEQICPPQSSGPRLDAAAVAIDESESEQGQVLLIDEWNALMRTSGEVHKVDLASGVCTPLPPLLSSRRQTCTAARLPDGRIVCVGKNVGDSEGITAEILEKLPNQGSLTSAASWRWRELPGMIVARGGGGGCVLSDGRFAIFGGWTGFGASKTKTEACEVLSLDGDDERWEQLLPMHEVRVSFACAAVGGCVIVAGGNGGTVEVYEEALGRWRRLPCSLPPDAGLHGMGSALMRR
jgi:hypothetical protein